MLFLQQFYFLFVFIYHFLLFAQNFLHRGAIWSGVNELRVERLNFFLQQLLLFSLLEKLIWSLLQGFHDISLIFLNLFLLLLQLYEFWLINEHFIFFFQLASKFSQLSFILSDQGFLVQVLIDCWLVLNTFGSMCKFQWRETLLKSLRCGRNHCQHCCLAISSQTVRKQSR